MNSTCLEMSDREIIQTSWVKHRQYDTIPKCVYVCYTDAYNRASGERGHEWEMEDYLRKGQCEVHCL